MVRAVGEKTILLVDDEPALAKVNAQILEETFDVITATDGTEALELVDESIDIVMLDRRMPDMSGDEVLAVLRERGYDMPVGMISAIHPDVDILDLPLDDYITKPIDIEQLREAAELLAVRTELDEESRELFSLIAKKTTLEKADAVDKDESEPFQKLVSRMETLRTNGTKDIGTLIAKNHTNPMESKYRPAIAEDANSP